MKLRSIENLDIKKLRGKKVLLRADFNVVMKGTKVLEPFRLERTLPTIKFLLKNKCQIILATHLGRPAGKIDPALSLKPIFKLLQSYLPKVKMRFVAGKINGNYSEPIILLENLRFNPGEEANDLVFAKNLASLADLYVNDAFAVCYRESASLVAVTKFLPSYAGLNLVAEVKYLSNALSPKTPAVAIFGGIKLDSKFGVIKNFLKKYQTVLVGGGVANLFLKAQGFEIGNSFIDVKFLADAKKLKSKKIILPTDLVVAKSKTFKSVEIKTLSKNKNICQTGEAIYDIGPATIEKFCLALLKAKTIVWGGPLGLVERPEFSTGTETIARVVASLSKRATSICGGGDTIAVIDRLNLGKKMSFISTGGGAMLEFLEGKVLPGIKPLILLRSDKSELRRTQ